MQNHKCGFSQVCIVFIPSEVSVVHVSAKPLLTVCLLAFLPSFHPHLHMCLKNLAKESLLVCFPAGDEVITLNMIKSAPVGPVAGGIMGCIMVLVLAVYAYRHQIHRRSHQHMSPLAAQGELTVNPRTPPGRWQPPLGCFQARRTVANSVSP